MENLDIVAILGTGVSGFSFLMLFVGYKLTSDIQNKILDINLQDIDTDKLQTLEKITDKQLINTRVFLAFSVVFLIAGLIMIAYRPEAKIILSLTPMESEYPPIVYVQDKPVALDENGKGSALLKDEHALTIDNGQVFSELAEIKLQLSATSSAEKAFVERLANNSDDSGYGDLLGE